MNQTKLGKGLVFFAVVVFNVLLLLDIEEKVQQINCFSYDTAFYNFRSHNVSEETLEIFLRAADDTEAFAELLTMYFATENMVTDVDVLQEKIALAKKYHFREFEKIKRNISAVWSDLQCFPVGKVANDKKATVTFVNSWMQKRTFGGDRGHEGCDIMATVNERGIYPVYSMTDGVVEQIGWLRLGGYRIGIRSDSGAYFYYAHLAEYAKQFVIGERVNAGTLLGFMGDTGYSEVEGTTGNFDVHLHLGIYLNDENGTEFSVNSYPMLYYLWKKQEDLTWQ